MSDSLKMKLSKGKRHRSSSSLAGAVLEGTFSERKLDIKASIPEVDDQFAIAEARCDDLQEKIDLVKVLKRKRKLKKRSMTQVTDQQMAPETIPFISVRTQPKKKGAAQAARLQRVGAPSNSTRGYLDPTTTEQHRMISRNAEANQEQKTTVKSRVRSCRADGDGAKCGRGVQITTHDPSSEAVCSDDELDNYSDNRFLEHPATIKKRPTADKLRPLQGKSGQRKLIQMGSKEVLNQREERVVVELFKKNHNYQVPKISQENIPKYKPDFGNQNIKKAPEVEMYGENTGPLVKSTKQEHPEEQRLPRRIRDRTRHYELPTVASRMKRTGARFYAATTNTTNIPFVVSKSTAPSHNIGVNIQQVLNGLKNQQPLSGIPLTIAHHMGLGHIPTHGTTSDHVTQVLENHDINSIRLGQRLLRLPTYKYMSYRCLLNLYRESDGMVSRFLRAINRPQYFCTSMYNLGTNREDINVAAFKNQVGKQEARQSLSEYSSLYREYVKLEKSLGNRYDPELARRRDELQRELTSREEHIRKVVQEYETTAEKELTTLRASASIADEGYRHSTFKLHSGDA